MDDALAAAARRHGGLMAQRGAAEHGFAGEPSLASRVTQAGGHFVWLSENVVQGPAVETIQAEFLKSPNHRANMLDSDMDSIGVGVVERGGKCLRWKIFRRRSKEFFSSTLDRCSFCNSKVLPSP